MKPTSAQLDQACSSTAPITTCNRYSDTNGLFAPPDRYSCTDSAKTSHTKVPNSWKLVTGQCGCPNHVMTFSITSPASTTNICAIGSVIPKP